MRVFKSLLQGTNFEPFFLLERRAYLNIGSRTPELSNYLKEVLNWVKEETDQRKKFDYLHFILTIGIGNIPILLKFLKTHIISIKNALSIPQFELFLRLLRENLFSWKDNIDLFYNEFNEVLISVLQAERKSVSDYGKTPKWNVIERRLANIQKDPINLNNILRNLPNYPNIQKIFPEKWFRKHFNRLAYKHPLFMYLNHHVTKKPDHLYLQHYERVFWYFTTNEIQNSGKYANLKNWESFEDMFAELEVIAVLIEKFGRSSLNFKPLIDKKELDCELTINTQQILIEIINPKLSENLRYSGSEALPIGRRLINKLHSEKKHHNLSSQLKKPLIFIIRNSAAFSRFDVKKALSLPDFDFLSGIILYNRDFFHISKLIAEFFKNQKISAQRIISKDLINDLELSFNRFYS